jgi:hypothetical protein
VVRVVIALLALAVLLVVILLVVLNRSSDRDSAFELDSFDSALFTSTDDSDSVVYGAATEYDVSFGTSGFFYADENVICYYDPEAKQSYVLCGKANCSHDAESADSCNAYFEASWTEEGLDNVAQYGDYVYCTAYNTDTNTIDLFRVDPVNDSRKSLAAFPAFSDDLSDYDGQHWACYGISSVFYAGGYAWMNISWGQLGGDGGATQLCGVDLSSGEMVYFNELNAEDDWEYAWTRVCPDYIIYQQTRCTEEMVDQPEYYAQFGDGPATIDGNSFDSFADYFAWYCNVTPIEYVYKAYDIQNKTTLTLDAGVVTEPLGDYGMLVPHQYYGIEEGKAIYGEYTMGEDGGVLTTLYWQDLETQEKELLCELGHGSVLNIPVSRRISLVRNDGTLIYATNPYGIDATGKDSEQIDIMSLDLSTGESTYLYTDNYHNSVRILKDTADGYYVHLYGETEADAESNFCYYWISREDYRSGNFDNLIKYQVDVSWR